MFVNVHVHEFHLHQMCNFFKQSIMGGMETARLGCRRALLDARVLKQQKTGFELFMMQQEETMKIIFHVVTADGPNWRTPTGAGEWMWWAWDSSEGAPKEVVLKISVRIERARFELPRCV